MDSFGHSEVKYTRVVLGLLVLLLVMVVGTAGYMIIEDWSLLDALYMASITVTTVGYSEIEPLSETGKAYTIALMFVGVGTAFYILTAVVATIIEGDLRHVIGARRMKSMIERLQGHYIVCGYGRVGEQIVHELEAREAPFVVVDASDRRVEDARSRGWLVVHGDATLEDTLIQAGIQRCRSVIAASDTDATNTYITLTAKALRPETYVVARVSSELVERKLLQAGADRTVSLYRIGGRRLAFAALQPLVTEFIDIFPDSESGDRVLAEVLVDEASGFAGMQLLEAMQGAEDLVVLAVRDSSGRLDVGPPRSRVLGIGDVLIVVGAEQDLSVLGLSNQHHTSARPGQRRRGLRRFLLHF